MKFFYHFFLFLLSVFFYSCKDSHSNFQTVKSQNLKETVEIIGIPKDDSSSLEKYFVSKNLVDLNTIDSSIRVTLLYSTTHNFLQKQIYFGLKKCYLPMEVALKLKKAQEYLKFDFPLYSLIVFDGTRPLSIQKKMWNELVLPDKIKINYLANPNDISLHNYGAAVDIGIIGENQVLLDMGTSFDFFGELSEPKKEKIFYESGKLSKEAFANRLLLRNTMVKAGFLSITSEWWHFNYTTKKEAATKFELIQ